MSGSERTPCYRMELNMLSYATMFIVFGVIAGGLNWTGVATVATQNSWILLLSGIGLLLVHLMTRRTIHAP